jgi:hypothetical protein
MTNTDLLQAMGRIDPKLIADAAPDVAQKKTVNKTWVKWASLAACFAFVIVIGVMSGDANNIVSAAMVNDYGPFIFMPVLLVSLIPLCFFAKQDIKAKTMMIVDAISLVSINMLNVLGVYLHSQFGGINIIGYLPIIFITSNVGASISIITNTVLAKKIKTRWLKLLLWLIVSVVSIILACMVHNLLFLLRQLVGHLYMF